MRFQPIYDIAALCAKKKVTQVVLCPGSRCAPLTLAFTRHPDITTRTFSDERSAAFIALGMARKLGSPVVLVCTSGTAAYNFAPAVAEAFFSNIPLIVFTADRPAEWIAQQDGQTIYQENIFGNHVKKSFRLPQDYAHPDDSWAINRMVNEAINLAMRYPTGPVHINAPFREPLYPAPDENIIYDSPRVINVHPSETTLTTAQQQVIRERWSQFNRILVVAGQQEPNEGVRNALKKFLDVHAVPFVTDILSNLHPVGNAILHADLFLGAATEDVKKKLQPDLLITFGESLISKNLKLFLRNHKPLHHWHIQPAGDACDTFKSVTDIFNSDPSAFFEFLASIEDKTSEHKTREAYREHWQSEERKAKHVLQHFFPQPDLNELELVKEVMQRLPQACSLHLANSMSVRYANMIALDTSQSGVRVFANRGTSGIDGCTSTSVGDNLVSSDPTFLITGDLAFFYDRNAFWHNYPLKNLRILLLNNHGGIIFNMIDGPAALPEAPEYFVTHQRLTAHKLCEEFGFEHLSLSDKSRYNDVLEKFFSQDGSVKILELETDIAINKTVLDNLKLKIKQYHEA